MCVSVFCLCGLSSPLLCSALHCSALLRSALLSSWVCGGCAEPENAGLAIPLAKEILKYLLPRVVDPKEVVRKQALRGFGNLESVWNDEVRPPLSRRLLAAVLLSSIALFCFGSLWALCCSLLFHITVGVVLFSAQIASVYASSVLSSMVSARYGLRSLFPHPCPCNIAFLRSFIPFFLILFLSLSVCVCVCCVCVCVCVCVCASVGDA